MLEASIYPAALFVILVFLMAALVVGGVYYGTNAASPASTPRIWPAAITALALSGWLVVVALLARSGLFTDFVSLPPRIGIVLVPPLLVVLVLTFTPLVDRLLQRVPPQWLITSQAFRVGVEVVLWLLYMQGEVAPLMTFHGRNFDIAAGLTAPLVSFWCFGRGRRRTRWAVVWNVVGLLLLFNVAAHGLLSTPAPFRQFVTEPPFEIVARLPYIWLPSFLVPLALLLHTLSLRQLAVLRNVSADQQTTNATSHTVA